MITSLAQNVKIGTVLNLCSQDITHCPGLDDLIGSIQGLLKNISSCSISNVSIGSLRATVCVKFEEDEVILISSDEECITISYCSSSSTIQHVDLGLMFHQLVLQDLALRELICESSEMQLST
jgi:hypothetical protein